MVKQVFSDIISNPDNLHQIQTGQITEVIDAFPYCQIAHLLLAKKLKQEDSMLFEKQLNLTAAYAPSRKILHDLIQGNAILSSDQERMLPDEIIEEEKKNENEKIEEKVVAKETFEDKQLNDLLQSEIQSTYDLSQIPPLENKNEGALPKKINPNEKHHFSDWIRFMDGEQLEDETRVNEIIDKFIEEAPRIGEINYIETSSENLAKKNSGELENDLVTETLAKIHLDQGNRLMAIEIYEQLMVKYPEKRPYFAAQINFIKK